MWKTARCGELRCQKARKHMSKWTGRRDMTGKLLKTALSPNQSTIWHFWVVCILRWITRSDLWHTDIRFLNLITITNQSNTLICIITCSYVAEYLQNGLGNTCVNREQMATCFFLYVSNSFYNRKRVSFSQCVYIHNNIYLSLTLCLSQITNIYTYLKIHLLFFSKYLPFKLVRGKK